MRPHHAAVVVLSPALPRTNFTSLSAAVASFTDGYPAIGVQQSGLPVTDFVVVPDSPIYQGVRLTWQAACSGPVTGLQASSPAAVVVS